MDRNIFDECVRELFDAHNITASDKSSESFIDELYDFVNVLPEYDSDNFIACGAESEVDKLKKKLEIERNKTICPKCNGAGIEKEYFLSKVSTSDCYHCNGERYIK